MFEKEIREFINFVSNEIKIHELEIAKVNNEYYYIDFDVGYYHVKEETCNQSGHALDVEYLDPEYDYSLLTRQGKNVIKDIKVFCDRCNESIHFSRLSDMEIAKYNYQKYFEDKFNKANESEITSYWEFSPLFKGEYGVGKNPASSVLCAAIGHQFKEDCIYENDMKHEIFLENCNDCDYDIFSGKRGCCQTCGMCFIEINPNIHRLIKY